MRWDWLGQKGVGLEPGNSPDTVKQKKSYNQVNFLAEGMNTIKALGSGLVVPSATRQHGVPALLVTDTTRCMHCLAGALHLEP